MSSPSLCPRPPWADGSPLVGLDYWLPERERIPVVIANWAGINIYKHYTTYAPLSYFQEECVHTRRRRINGFSPISKRLTMKNRKWVRMMVQSILRVFRTIQLRSFTSPLLQVIPPGALTFESFASSPLTIFSTYIQHQYSLLCRWHQTLLLKQTPHLICLRSLTFCPYNCSVSFFLFVSQCFIGYFVRLLLFLFVITILS